MHLNSRFLYSLVFWHFKLLIKIYGWGSNPAFIHQFCQHFRSNLSPSTFADNKYGISVYYFFLIWGNLNPNPVTQGEALTFFLIKGYYSQYFNYWIHLWLEKRERRLRGLSGGGTGLEILSSYPALTMSWICSTIPWFNSLAALAHSPLFCFLPAYMPSICT